jgi:hypothetical protein
VGTFWPTPEKAYQEPGKKRLYQDMKTLAEGIRDADPFGIIALLITHHGSEDLRYKHFKDTARSIGDTHGLALILDEPIPLPQPTPDSKAFAHQLVWAGIK